MLGNLKKAKVWMVGAALVAMSGLAVAAGPGYGRGNNPNCPGWGNQLNLSPEQQTKMNDLRTQFWKDTVNLRNEMQTKRLELRTLWTNPTPDKAQIEAKQKELNALREKMQAKATEYKLEARKNLTPEQAAQIGTYGPGKGFGGPGWGKGRMGRGNWGGPGSGPCGGAGSGPCGGGYGPGPGAGFGPGGARF
jgi:Spy/CpxP family protein refolding chaperone